MVGLHGMENGYSVVRPSRQSVSVAYNSNGQKLGHVDWFTLDKPMFAAKVPTRGHTTFYEKTGDWFTP